MTESRQPVITVLTAPGEDAPAGIEAVKARAEVRFAWDEQTLRDDVIVTNARGIFDRTIAEYVLCSILMFAKDFPRSIRLQDKHQWQHRDTERAEGKQVLVVGAGSIGRQIGRLVKAIGMHPHGIARTPRKTDPDLKRCTAMTNFMTSSGTRILW